MTNLAQRLRQRAAGDYIYDDDRELLLSAATALDEDAGRIEDLVKVVEDAYDLMPMGDSERSRPRVDWVKRAAHVLAVEGNHRMLAEALLRSSAETKGVQGG